jgi:hypothetical protein
MFVCTYGILTEYIYPPAMKHGVGESSIKGGFDGNIIYKWMIFQQAVTGG